MTTLKAVAVDDEVNALKTIQILIDEYCENIELVGTADSVLDGIKLINSTQPDIIILDIEMPYGTGFDILESLPKSNANVVFVTAYDNYAIRAIKSEAVDYIMKPIDIEEFVASMNKIKEKIERSSNAPESKEDKLQIAVPILGGIRTIEMDQLIYLQAEGAYTHLHLIHEKPILVSRNLKQFEEALPEEIFCRIHHSIIVNTHHVKEVSKKDNCVTLTTNDQLEISRRRKDEFFEFLQKRTRFI